MIANPGIPHPAAVPHHFTLNDLRMHSPGEEESSPTSALSAPSPLVLAVVAAVVLAIGAFFWLDPLNLLAPAEAGPPSLALAPSAEKARSTEKLEIVAPPTPVPAANSVEVPVAPAAVAQAPHVAAPAARPRAAVKPESLGNPAKASTTAVQASPKEETPVLLTKPEEMTDSPIVPKVGDDTAPKPAATE
jgi:hypothetical protein